MIGDEPGIEAPPVWTLTIMPAFCAMRTIGEYPNLADAMLKRGWSVSKARKILGENWLRVLKEVWGA